MIDHIAALIFDSENNLLVLRKKHQTIEKNAFYLVEKEKETKQMNKH